MANTNTPYIAKNAAALTNPTALSIFTQTASPIATVASTQVLKSAFVKYNGFSQYGAGYSDNINLVHILVKAAGRVTGGTSTNWTPSIQIASSIPSTTAATAITPVTGYTATPTTSAQSSSTAVAIPAPTGELVLFFAAGGLFSASNADNVAYLDLFQVEEL